MKTMSNDNDRKLVTRTFEGVETLVSTGPGEIFIDVPEAKARYIRVDEGDTVQEGDIRSRTAEELESASLKKWTITAIGPETIIGTERETGERREWDREVLEHKLAVAGYSTNLTDFERVNVGASNATDRDGRRSDEKSVTVTVYGNDSRKFTQKYRFVDDDELDGDVRGGAERGDERDAVGGDERDDVADDERRLVLAESDDRVERFEDGLRERFDQAVELALRNEGYAV